MMVVVVLLLGVAMDGLQPFCCFGELLEEEPMLRGASWNDVAPKARKAFRAPPALGYGVGDFLLLAKAFGLEYHVTKIP